MYQDQFIDQGLLNGFFYLYIAISKHHDII